jgi:Domain of unknown function (DUF6457)
VAPRARGLASSLTAVHEWLEAARDRIAAATDDDVGALELSPVQVDAVLELARIAAHESGERTNAPLVCYLAGLAAGRSDTDAEDVIDAAAGVGPDLAG